MTDQSGHIAQPKINSKQSNLVRGTRFEPQSFGSSVWRSPGLSCMGTFRWARCNSKAWSCHVKAAAWWDNTLVLVLVVSQRVCAIWKWSWQEEMLCYGRLGNWANGFRSWKITNLKPSREDLIADHLELIPLISRASISASITSSTQSGAEDRSLKGNFCNPLDNLKREVWKDQAILEIYLALQAEYRRKLDTKAGEQTFL